MGKFFLILRYRGRIFLRDLQANAFEVFLLGSIVLGGAWWVLGRYLSSLHPVLVSWTEEGGVFVQQGVGWALASVLLLWGIPGALRELYGHDSRVLDGLPRPPNLLFLNAFLGLLIRAAPPFVLLFLVFWLLAKETYKGGAGQGLLWPWGGALLIVLVAMVLARLGLLLLWVQGHKRGAPKLVSLVVVAILGAWCVWLFGEPLGHLWFQSLGLHRAQAGWWVDGWKALGILGLVLECLRRLFRRWYGADLEVGRSLLVAPHRGTGRPDWYLNLWQALRSWILGRKSTVRYQMLKDGLLVLRRFSPAVRLTFLFALAFDGLMITLFFEHRLPQAGRQSLIVLAGTLSVLAVVALVPFLVRDQLPRLWIERAAGVSYESVWRAKLGVATCLGVFPLAVASVLLFAFSFSGMPFWIPFLQLLTASGMVASIVALSSFEIAEQPFIGLVFSSMVGLALAALIVFYPQAWWLWLAFYGYVVSQVAARAGRRVQILGLKDW